MAHRTLAAAFSIIVTGTSIAAAATPAPIPPAAPPGNAATRYCMRVEPVTGTLLERVVCLTRDQWDFQGVNVDKDWPKEGVRVIDG